MPNIILDYTPVNMNDFLIYFKDNIERFIIFNNQGGIEGIQVKSDLILRAEYILYNQQISCTSCNLSHLATKLLKIYLENNHLLNESTIEQQGSTNSKEGETSNSGRGRKGKKITGKVGEE